MRLFKTIFSLDRRLELQSMIIHVRDLYLPAVYSAVIVTSNYATLRKDRFSCNSKKKVLKLLKLFKSAYLKIGKLIRIDRKKKGDT